MDKTEKPLSEIKTATATVKRIHDKIVTLDARATTEEGTLENIIENIAAIYKVGEKDYCSCLIIPSPFALPSKESRELLEKELKHMPYVAVVLKGLAQKILMNFVASIIGKNKMKSFTNEENAMAWLKAKVGT